MYKIKINIWKILLITFDTLVHVYIYGIIIVANAAPFGGRLPNFGPISLIAKSPSRET